MNRLIVFQMVLFAFVIVGVVFGSLGLDRAGQVFLIVGMIDLIISIAALRGWPILRGDSSSPTPLSKRDSGERARDEYAMDQERPSIGFVVKVAITGIAAIGIGVVILLLYS